MLYYFYNNHPPPSKQFEVMIFWSSYPDFPYKKAFPENHKKGGSKELQKRFRVVVTRDFRGLLPPLCIRVISDPR